ncbi:MAG: AtpZ/AtpI family protein [Dehalococcoidia bacterium]|nr:AtpZ/AtpI family protein [Dehalococcoidia bacterium]
MPWWALTLRVTGIGWFIAISIVIGICAGLKLDTWIHTKPLFMLIGLLLGTIVAFYGTYRAVQPIFNPPGGPVEPPDQTGSEGRG